MIIADAAENGARTSRKDIAVARPSTSTSRTSLAFAAVTTLFFAWGSSPR